MPRVEAPNGSLPTNPLPPVVVWFGKPLPPEQVRQMTNEQLADWLTHTLRQMQHDCRRKQGKQPYDYSA